MRETKSSDAVDGEIDRRHLDFNPLGGVTFRDNPSSDVAIVGVGYGEDSHQTDPKPSMHASKARERRRVTKSKCQ